MNALDIYFKYILRLFLKIYFYIVIFFMLRMKTNTSSSIYIFDLDNTLANTWPSLIQGCKSHSDRLKNLKPINGMVRIFNKLISKDKNVFVVTARSYEHFFITKNWLNQNTDFQKAFKLILVERPKDKLQIFKYIKKNYQNIVCYDDLSYDHENDDIKFYDDIIKEAKNDVTKYFGYDFIQANFE